MAYRHRMIEIVTNRQNKKLSIRISCPVPPVKTEDISIAKALAPKFLNAMKTQPKLCADAFNYFINNAWHTTNEIIFKNPNEPDEAKRFVEFLEFLGIKKSSIYFTSYSEAKRSSAFNQWKQHLGLTSRHHFKKLSPPMKNKNTDQWLGIKPVFRLVAQSGSKGTRKMESSIAFRYLMVLGAALL